MPIVSQFYGIIISMYFNDKEQHNLPHIHVQYAEYNSTFDLKGNKIVGKIPKKQQKLVEAWIEIHKEELNALWTIVQNGNEIFRIEPLK